VEWQKYDAQMHIFMMRTHSVALRESALNVARIQIFSEVVSHIGNGLSILDVGCGDGVISEPMVKMGNYVTCVELPTIATLAQRCGVPSVVAGDAEQLALASDSFDVVLASEVIEHLWKPQNFLGEAHRVLRSGGYLIIETPEGKESLHYDSHKHYFTVERLKEILGTRFTVCEVKRLKPTGTAQTPTIILLLRKSS
jgi:2-polyprenyl-3-methyl-5-hydroxy-6-metoxy-1,4-benzoquinol methylase